MTKPTTPSTSEKIAAKSRRENGPGRELAIAKNGGSGGKVTTIISILNLVGMVGIGIWTVFIAIQANSISGQVKNLSAWVNINLMSLKSDYVQGSKQTVYHLSIELDNAGPGVASHVRFGVGTEEGKPTNEAIGVNTALHGSIELAASDLSFAIADYSCVTTSSRDPASIVTLWVVYRDGLGQLFTREFPPTPRFNVSFK